MIRRDKIEAILPCNPERSCPVSTHVMSYNSNWKKSKRCRIPNPNPFSFESKLNKKSLVYLIFSLKNCCAETILRSKNPVCIHPTQFYMGVVIWRDKMGVITHKKTKRVSFFSYFYWKISLLDQFVGHKIRCAYTQPNFLTFLAVLQKLPVTRRFPRVRFDENNKY